MVISGYHPFSFIKDKKISTILFILSFFYVPLFAFNHPEIQWKTVESENFLIHFSEKTKPAVFAAWNIAEETYNVFKSLYSFEGLPKINLVLSDYDDYHYGGHAEWSQRTIVIWIPDVHFDFRSNKVWLRSVITHELAHIMSLAKKSRMQIMDWTFQTQYISPDVKFDYRLPVAFTTFFPHWFTEGTAQLRAEEMGGDCWDSRRSMVFRCAILDGKLLTLDEMGYSNHSAQRNELVYNQGYLFVKFLEKRIGKQDMASLWNSSRRNKIFGMNLDRYFIQNFKISLDSLYKIWKDSMFTSAESTVPINPAPHTSVWEKGTINKKPQVSEGLKYIGWLTNHRDDFFRTDLIIFKNGEDKPVVRLKYAKAGWTFSPDGNTVYYIKSRKPDSNGSFFNDLFAYDIQAGNETRLTESARIYDVTVSSDGKELFCVQYFNNAYRLVSYSLGSSQFLGIVSGEFGEPIKNVSIINTDSSMDSLRLILSKNINGKSGIFILQINTKEMTPLINTQFQEEDPYYAQNGRIYFSADYDGIFNIYSILPDGTDLNRHTHVFGGAFSPILYKNDTLLFSEYTSNGFRISKCKLKGKPYQIPSENSCHFKPVPNPSGTVRIKSELYQKKYLKPVLRLNTSLILKDEDKAFQNRIKTGSVGTPPWSISLDFLTELRMDKSDALGHKKMHLGGAVMINTLWELKNASDNYLINRNSYSKSSINNDSIDIIVQPFLIPFFGIEINSLKPTIGINSHALLILFIPALINIEPFLEYQLARDVHMGLKSQIALYPLTMFSNFKSGFYLNAPLWIRWDLEKYINEDISYNSSGRGSYSAHIGVEIEPIEYIRDTRISKDSMVSDTTIKSNTSFFYGIDMSNSFPISKYTSLKISTVNFGKKYNRDVYSVFSKKDTVYYNLLISSINQAEFIFPIVRNIDRGKVFADNLYGNIFYQLEFKGSNEFLLNPKSSLFTDKSYISKYASLSHKIGLGVELGLIKNYIFKRKLEVKTAWDIFNEKINVDISARF